MGLPRSFAPQSTDMSPRKHLRLVATAAVDARADVDEAAPASDSGYLDEAERTEAPPPAASKRASHRGLVDLGDAALVALVIEGEMGAAECLYRRHASFALNLAARIAGSSAEIEDVVHDAFLRAFEGVAELRNAAAFRTWLGSIVVHGMRSRLRREKLRRLLGLSSYGNKAIDIDSIASSNASPAMRAELAQVYALLRTLPADDRIAWTLRYVEGHELGEAAELAGCSLATVKRRIQRAQQYIDEHFVDFAAAEEEP